MSGVAELFNNNLDMIPSIYWVNSDFVKKKIIIIMSKRTAFKAVLDFEKYAWKKSAPNCSECVIVKISAFKLTKRHLD